MNSKFNPTQHRGVYISDANSDKFVVIRGNYISKQFDKIEKAIEHLISIEKNND